MFYENQPVEQQTEYKRMLSIVGALSELFSESKCPYLPYRAHENIFCKYFRAINLSRKDCSADAQKGKIGIGLKTWMGGDDQKIAEFGKLKTTYVGLSGLDLVKQISLYRNERIRVTKNMYGIEQMIYHIVRRVPGAMQILECAFDSIDIENVRILPNRGNENNTYFTDGKHTYHFSTSKNTLYMLFENADLLDSFEVDILQDPYTLLMEKLAESVSDVTPLPVVESQEEVDKMNTLCLRLYSVRNGRKYVPAKSGLNQWNASGRKRDPDEVYIAYQAVDRKRNPNFFPPRDTSFLLHLPDGTTISAKVCQEADKSNPLVGKAIMSNPNKVLGNWLLRDVFEIKPGVKLTYEMLELFGVDSVIFTKIGDREYSIDFSPLGTYELFYGKNEEADE